ncbi:MAG: hypothetical protein FD123_778 [Bacteroidetes bacterium]|nr:MAG: hypothetical protein FD123_778 [Bacteroidota bacterium]
MKKLYSTREYKAWHKRKLQKIERQLQAKNNSSTKRSNQVRKNNSRGIENGLPFAIYAPVDFRLIENAEECLMFFRNIRNEENVKFIRNYQIVVMSLFEVEQIDYATISVLTAISDDLKSKGVVLQGNFPRNKEARKFIEDSGFLSHMVNETNRPFPKPGKSELIFFEKGCGTLSGKDNRRISQVVKDSVGHLTGETSQSLSVKTILLEICGNSIEWGGTENKQWLLGVKYEPGKVVFTVTDVGKGILQTLHRKFKKKLLDAFSIKNDAEILLGAFEKKYGSNTQEINRNKGLPAVKVSAERGILLDLKVLTNNVILHFDDHSRSMVFDSGSPRFKGTLYQWEMTKECLSKI